MRTSNKGTIIENFVLLKPEPIWSFRDVTRAQTTALTHSYHRYPAKFIPNIVEKLLIDYTINLMLLNL